MKKLISCLLLFTTYHVHSEQPLRGPPLLEKPVLLSSYLPASMQIIAHLTDLMKYEVRPSTGSSSTTTTVRPTPTHGPALYSPQSPLGAAGFFSKSTPYEDYVERLRSGGSYFDRYSPEGRSLEEEKAANLEVDDREGLKYLAAGPREIWKEVNRIDDYGFVDEEDTVLNFLKKFDYDYLSLRKYVVGNKKVPPTRAYVTLLFLYDLLNKESKKLQLNKFGGYTDEVLQVLIQTSQGASAGQLHTVLSKVVERRDVKDQVTTNKIKTLLTDLEQSDSYINDALKTIPPLEYIP